MQEIWVQSLGWKDSLENEMATHSSILAWRIPWTERGALWATVHGVTEQSDTIDRLSNNNPDENHFKVIIDLEIFWEIRAQSLY